MSNQFSGLSTDEVRAATEDARRAARFKAAKQRIRKIVDAAPRFTEQELQELSVLLAPRPQ